MPAQAYSVNYNTQTVSLQFAQTVAGMYDRAPAALRARVGTPVVYVTDIPSFKRMPYNSKEAFSKDTVFYGQAVRNVGTPVGRLVFIAKNVMRLDAEEQFRVVLHEMVHLYDFERKVDKSQAPAFVAEFKKDIAYIKDVLRSSSERKEYDDIKIALAYSHYMDAPKEAFAEAGARLISPPSNQHDRRNFFVMFPNTTRYVYEMFAREGIVSRSLADIVQAPETQVVAQPKPVQQAVITPAQSEREASDEFQKRIVPMNSDGSCPQGASPEPTYRKYCLTERVWPSQQKRIDPERDRLKAENDARIQSEVDKARAENIAAAKEHEKRMVRLGADGKCPEGSSLEPLQGTYCLKDYDQKRVEEKARSAVFAE
jgi:hypothetical protein